MPDLSHSSLPSRKLIVWKMLYVYVFAFLLSRFFPLIPAVTPGKDNHPAILPWVAQQQADQYVENMKDWHGQMKNLGSLNSLTQGKEVGKAFMKSNQAFLQAKQAYQSHQYISKAGLKGVGPAIRWQWPDMPIQDPMPHLTHGTMKQHHPNRILGFPEQRISNQGFLEHGIPARQILKHGALKQVISKQDVAMHAFPTHNARIQGSPIKGFPMYNVPLHRAQGKGLPHQDFPWQSFPIQKTLYDRPPVQKMHMQSVPWQGIRTQSADALVYPKMWTPKQKTPKQDTLRQSNPPDGNRYPLQGFAPPGLVPKHSGHASRRIALYDTDGASTFYNKKVSGGSSRHGATQQGGKTA